MEIEPTSFKVAGRFCGIASKKLYRWYKASLSGFEEALLNGDIGKNDIIDKGRTIKVPIVAPLNMGKSMAIDEKYIGGEYYTILSNNETNKIAVLAQTTKAYPLGTILKPLGAKLFEVETYTRDLDHIYDKVGREWFMNAAQSADKFHVLKHAFDALQSMRMKIKELELLRVHAAQDDHLRNELRIKTDLYKKYRMSYDIKDFVERFKILDNEETIIQMITRSRYLLFKRPDDWNRDQEKRAIELFNRYPIISDAYELIIKFRSWYDQKIGTSRKIILKSLNLWYADVKIANIQDIAVFASLVKRNEGVIINYFLKGATNARAEALNANIQRFVSSNFGQRDIDFFFFRLAKFYS